MTVFAKAGFLLSMLVMYVHDSGRKFLVFHSFFFLTLSYILFKLNKHHETIDTSEQHYLIPHIFVQIKISKFMLFRALLYPPLLDLVKGKKVFHNSARNARIWCYTSEI